MTQRTYTIEDAQAQRIAEIQSLAERRGLAISASDVVRMALRYSLDQIQENFSSLPEVYKGGTEPTAAV